MNQIKSDYLPKNHSYRLKNNCRKRKKIEFTVKKTLTSRNKNKHFKEFELGLTDTVSEVLILLLSLISST